jgi:leucyl-tRNA synthetase
LELVRATHQTIRKVTNDMERLRFNTMVAALMELTNHLTKVKESGQVSESAWEEAVEKLILLMAPSTPHLAEELWQRTGHEYSIHNQSWPKWDEELAKEEEITLVVQVNGKLRDRIIVPASITEEEAKKVVLNSPKIRVYIQDRTINSIIYVPGKLANLVVK